MNRLSAAIIAAIQSRLLRKACVVCATGAMLAEPLLHAVGGHTGIENVAMLVLNTAASNPEEA